MDNCRSFAGARANKDGHREPEPASLGHIIGFHQRRARKYRIFCIIQKRKEKIEERRRRKEKKKDRKEGSEKLLLRPSTAFGRDINFFPRTFLSPDLKPRRNSNTTE